MMNEKLKSATVLLIVVLASVGVLAGANAAIERIAAVLAPEPLDLEELTAPFTAVTDGDMFARVEVNGAKYLKIYKDNTHVGYVVEASGEGYGDDPIVVLVGTNAELAITAVAVIAHSETGAIGGRAFSEENLALFEGQSAAEVEFEAVSGATISSKGLLSAVRKAADTLREALNPQ